MFDERAKSLLKTLVELHIADGQPIGSRTLSRQEGVCLSAATIRNVMAELEEHGFITSPHVSAGRVPTPKGYRLFLDTLLVLEPLEQYHAQAIHGHLQTEEPQRLLSSAAGLLSQLSHFAGIVTTPRRSTTQFRQIEFMRLSADRLLLIIVTQDGDVQNRILSIDREYSPSQLVEAANYLNANFAGMDLASSLACLQTELVLLRADIDGLMQKALEVGRRALSEEASDPCVISGERNLLVSDLSEDMGRLRQLFELFDQKTWLMQLLDESSRAPGVQIFIGGDSDVVPVEQVSVVAAPYAHDGRVVGTLGVVGPTRMAYDRVIPIVEITARLVSSILSGGGGSGRVPPDA